jgi:hypothetical protein
MQVARMSAQKNVSYAIVVGTYEETGAFERQRQRCGPVRSDVVDSPQKVIFLLPSLCLRT